MLQYSIIPEVFIENLLLQNKVVDKAGNSNYLTTLTCFFSCLFVKIMENEQVISTCVSDDPLIRYEKGSHKILSTFGDQLGTLLFKKPEKKLTNKAVSSLLIGCDELFEKTTVEIKDIGSIFENFYNKDFCLLSGGLKSTLGRKEIGMYFTRPEMVKFLIRAITDSNKNRIMESSFLDPSIGGGVFIYELLEYAEAKNVDIKNFLENNVYGVDINPLVVDIVRVSLWIKYNAIKIDPNKICSHIIQADSLLLFSKDSTSNITWESLFPDVFQEGGFAYIIGNPPWGKIKANSRDFSLFSNDLVKQHQGASLKNQMVQDDSFDDWQKYKTRVSLYAKALQQNPSFKHQKYMIDTNSTGGDFDLYKYFLEISYSILKDGGKLGYLIPASFYISESATGLRHLYLENGTIEYLVNFINKKRIFPIHPSYKFLLLVYLKHKGKNGSIKRAVFNLSDPSDLTDYQEFKKRDFVNFSVDFLEKCSKNYWTIPELRNVCEKKLMHKFYSKSSAVNRTSNRMNQASFNRELDMTLDSSLFIPFNKHHSLMYEEDLIPVYEGRMVNQFDSIYKTYVSGTGRTAVWRNNSFDERRPLQAQYYVRKKDVSAYYTNKYRACYCEITGQNNERTILASLIPADVICGNKVPTCKFEPDNKVIHHLYWIGIANSFIMDWIMRKKMTITINYFHWAQIPFPYASISSHFAIQITAASAIILERQNVFNLARILEIEQEEKVLKQYNEYINLSTSDLRLIIDYSFANFMGFTLEELINVLFDFPAIDRSKKGIVGDRRYDSKTTTSYVTRDLLLYSFMKSRNLDVSQDIVNLFAQAGLDISSCTGEIRNLDKRVEFYTKNEITPYQGL